MREQLVGYLLEALEPDERDRLEAELRRNPELQRELELLHESLDPLRSDDELIEPPAGLAVRTCALIAERSLAPASQPAVLPAGTFDGPRSPWSFADMAVAAGVFLAASTLLFPALQHSRDQARVAGCQNNLRQIGVALTDYSRRHGDYFPAVPETGNLAAAGIYAVELAENQLLPNDRTLVCPNSALAAEADEHPFQVPSRRELESARDAQLVELQKRMGGSYGYNLGYVNNGVYNNVHNDGKTTFAMMADAPSLDLEGRRSKNHRGCGQNVLYQDGHVRYLTDCVLENSQDHIFLNDDGLMAAGTHANDAAIGYSNATPMPRFIGGTR